MKPADRPGHGPGAGQGTAPARDRALSCQPPKEVTARPQRPTYRKSLVLTLKGKKQKVKLQNQQQNCLPARSPGRARRGPLRGLLAPPTGTLLSPYQNVLIFQSSNLVIKKKDVGSNNLPASHQVPDGSPRGRQGLKVPTGQRGPTWPFPRPWGLAGTWRQRAERLDGSRAKLPAPFCLCPEPYLVQAQAEPIPRHPLRR